MEPLKTDNIDLQHLPRCADLQLSDLLCLNVSLRLCHPRKQDGSDSRISAALEPQLFQSTLPYSTAPFHKVCWGTLFDPWPYPMDLSVTFLSGTVVWCQCSFLSLHLLLLTPSLSVSCTIMCSLLPTIHSLLCFAFFSFWIVQIEHAKPDIGALPFQLIEIYTMQEIVDSLPTVSESMFCRSNCVKADKMQPITANVKFKLKANHLICHIAEKKITRLYYSPFCGFQSASSFAFMI